MSQILPVITLTELTFPDISGKVLRAYGTVAFTAGDAYVTGGVPFGLIAFADARTVDFNGFLRCEVWDESVQGATVYTFRYSPFGDVLQIYANGVELANNSALPAALFTDTLLFEAAWDRTTTRG